MGRGVAIDRLNARLEPNGFPPVSDLGTDFSDGTRLIQLIVRTLTFTQCRRHITSTD